MDATLVQKKPQCSIGCKKEKEKKRARYAFYGSCSASGGVFLFLTSHFAPHEPVCANGRVRIAEVDVSTSSPLASLPMDWRARNV